MKPIKQITQQYQSLYSAGKELNVNPTQLKRWLDVGALVDGHGNVWIKTKGKVNAS